MLWEMIITTVLSREVFLFLEGPLSEVPLLLLILTHSEHCEIKVTVKLTGSTEGVLSMHIYRQWNPSNQDP